MSMGATHLYGGFRFAGALPSVAWQRELQASILEGLPLSRLLVVGCAQGDELEVLLRSHPHHRDLGVIDAVDPANVWSCLNRQRSVRSLGPRFRWYQLYLQQTPSLPLYGSYDVAQCGFVLHDIDDVHKSAAVAILARAVRANGWVVLSDIFRDPAKGRRDQAAAIYDRFLDEAHHAIQTTPKFRDGLRLLVGKADGPGLIRSRVEACMGIRDSFDTADALVSRATAAGLMLKHFYVNPHHPALRVYMFQRCGE